MSRSPLRIGIALGGGGARGLCHIEFLRVLDELSVVPSVIAGTSIGAIVGGLYAAGISAAGLADLLAGFGLKDLTKLVDLSMFNDKAVIKGKKIEHFLEERLPVTRFEECRIPLKVVATDFWNREPVIFESGDLAPAVRASMSLPAVFEPVRLGGRVLVDGGAVNPLPFDIIREDCDLLIAVDVTGERVPGSRSSLPGMLESVISTFLIMQSSIVEGKMISARPDIYIRPRLINVGLLDFHRDEEILAGVAEDVRDFRRTLRKRLARSGKSGGRRFGFLRPHRRERSD